jgi:hypothetical protein
MRSNFIAYGLSGALALGLSGFALPQMALAQQPGAVAPAASEPTASQLAAARELIKASGISRSFAAVVPQFMEQINANLTQTRPELSQDLRTVMTQLRPEFEAQGSEMLEIGARIYTRLMTEDELKTAAAFFNSETGKKYVNSQPAFLNEVVIALQGWQQKISTDMMTRVRVEMKKKGHEL